MALFGCVLLGGTGWSETFVQKGDWEPAEHETRPVGDEKRDVAAEDYEIKPISELMLGETSLSWMAEEDNPLS